MAMNESPRTTQNKIVYEQLRRLLMTGRVRAGIRLVEKEWADRLGVHRTALREAMILLAHEGLLRRGERGGYFTPLLEQRDLDEVMQVRTIIEVGAIRLIGVHPPTEDEEQRLTEACDAMQHTLDAGLELGFAEADRQFHRMLVKLSGNDRLISIYERAPLPIESSRLVDPEARWRAATQTIAEHREIQARLLNRDIPAAVDLLEKHLHTSHHLIPLY